MSVDLICGFLTFLLIAIVAKVATRDRDITMECHQPVILSALNNFVETIDKKNEANNINDKAEGKEYRYCDTGLQNIIDQCNAAGFYAVALDPDTKASRLIFDKKDCLFSLRLTAKNEIDLMYNHKLVKSYSLCAANIDNVFTYINKGMNELKSEMLNKVEAKQKELDVELNKLKELDDSIYNTQAALEVNNCLK